MPRHPCRILLLLVNLLASSLAQQNVTIDDTNPAIVYSTGTGADWGESVPSTMDYGGTHHIASGSGASASFTFTGVAVYFMSPLWPYAVFTQVQLDSQAPTPINLTDPSPVPPPPNNGDETRQSAVVWKAENLPNTAHTLVISKVPSPDRPYIVVDGIIYTELDPVSPSSSSSLPSAGSPTLPPTSSSSLPSAGSSSLSSISSFSHPTTGSPIPSNSSTAGTLPTNSSSNDSAHNNTLAIAVGTAVGALGLLVALVALWFLCRRGKKRPDSNTAPGAFNPPPSVLSRPPPPNRSVTQNGSMHTYQHVPSQSGSWSTGGPSPQMSTVGVPLLANTQPDSHSGYTGHVQGRTEDFNPWNSLQQQPQGTYIPQQHIPQQSPYYASTALSTITESNPGTLASNRIPLGAASPATESNPGTLASNRIPLGAASPATHPSPDLSYYTQVGDGVRLSYTSDLSGGAMSSGYPNQHSLYSSGSTGFLRSPPSSSALGDNGTLPRKLAEQNRPLIPVNRDEETEPSPPAYTS